MIQMQLQREELEAKQAEEEAKLAEDEQVKAFLLREDSSELKVDTDDQNVV